jgi:hypothetical protein
MREVRFRGMATAKDCIKSRNTSWHLLQTRNILIFRERSHNSFR